MRYVKKRYFETVLVKWWCWLLQLTECNKYEESRRNDILPQFFARVPTFATRSSHWMIEQHRSCKQPSARALSRCAWPKLSSFGTVLAMLEHAHLLSLRVPYLSSPYLWQEAPLCELDLYPGFCRFKPVWEPKACPFSEVWEYVIGCPTPDFLIFNISRSI